MSESFSLATGVVIERVGDDLVALIPDADVVTLTGQAADVVGRVLAGEDVDPSDEAVVALVDAGVLTAPAGLTRRKVMQLGAVATGVGVATLALPSVAAAASVTGALSGRWGWADYYAGDQAMPESDRQGYADPFFLRLLFVEWPEGVAVPSGDPTSFRSGSLEAYFSGFDEGARVAIFIVGSDGPPGPQPKVEPIEGPITGSFTWAGVTYQAVLRQVEDFDVEFGD